MSQLDPTIVNLTKAIRQIESGGDFAARGGSGEFGAYQYTPDTWNAQSKKYGVNAPLEAATRNQQNEVAYRQIKEWKDEGYNVGQIASMWNAGVGKPNAYKENWKGVNKFGVAYDTPAYATKVAKAYQGFKAQTPDPVQQQPVTPEPEKEGGLGEFAKEFVSPVTTMMARPFQAVQSGLQLAGSGLADKTGRMEASSAKVEMLRKEYVRQRESGQDTTYIKGQLQKALADSQGKIKDVTDVTSYKPFHTDTLIKEAPENFKDVKKDVGRAVQTVAFGVPGKAPITAGAMFGFGISLEQGNDVLSWQTAFHTVLGVVLGKTFDKVLRTKVAGMIGAKIYSTTGKVVGTVTPEVLKKAAATGGAAILKLVRSTKILPDSANTAIDATLKGTERVLDAPFKKAGSVIKKSDDQIISSREKALADIEEKYAQLRKNQARDPEGVAASRARVARSNVLTEDGMINKDGVIIGAKAAAEGYESQAIGQGNSAIRKLLEREGISVDINVVERELNKVIRESFTGKELISALNAAKKEIAGLRLANKSGKIKLVDVHKAKIDRQPGGKSYDNSATKKIDKQLARGHKQVVEKNSKENVKAINKELGTFYDDIAYIESLQGKRIGSGKLGKAITTAGSAIAGAVAGGAVGGIPGAVVGSFAAKEAGKRLSGRALSRALGKPTKVKQPKSKVLTEAVARTKRPVKRLPAPGQKAIPLASKNPRPKPKKLKKPQPKKKLQTVSKIGITSFRGKPVKMVSETKPYYKSTRAKGFQNRLSSTAEGYYVKVDNIRQTAGSWEGSIEPSFSAKVTGDRQQVWAYAANNARKANQDAVIIFTEGKGKGIEYVYKVKDPDKALKLLHKEGISGATVDGDRLLVYDFDGELTKNIQAFTKSVGVTPKINKGEVKLIFKDDYGKYTKGKRDIKGGLHPQIQKAGVQKPGTKERFKRITNKKDFERDTNLTGEKKKLESKAFDHVLKNEDKIIAAYFKKHGKIVNTDDFRPFFKEVGYNDGHLAAAVQEPSSYLSKRARNILLNKPGKYVVATAGGSGVGKTAASKNIKELRSLQDRATVIIDSNFSSMKSAEKFLDEVADSGKDFYAVFTYREFMEAIENGVIKRMLTNKSEMGRLVPSKVVARNHVGSWNVVKKLADDGHKIYFVDNTRGLGESKLIPLDELKKKIKYPSPEELTRKANAKIKELYENQKPFIDSDGKAHTITKEQYNSLIE